MRFFALRMTVEPKIPGAIIPRRVFTQPGSSATFWASADHFRFSNRPFGVKHFQTIRRCSVDVARRLVLLFGIGTKALPSWDSKTRRNNLYRGLAVRRTAGPSGSANSPHPSSCEGHHFTARWNSSVSPIDWSRTGPHAVATFRVQRNSVPSTQMRCIITANRRASATIAFFTASGDLHRPGLEPGPFLRIQHALSGFVEHDPHHLISAA